ncbi:MAG: prolipoprotein diacylglyceryl transferase [Flavobacteriaceae bacterium]|nr:prolipoprotein diacylglyceryl transferase [Flavobacteriaceae bacterium]
MFEIPFEPTFFGISWNIHLILEYLAFLIAFRYYVYLRKRTQDPISYSNRLSIILGAVFGALIGSRVVGWLEYPFLDTSENIWLILLNTKTIMGGLFGGLLGVEFVKKRIGETQSSGDLFTFPIILGIFIGRIGCFLSGINEFTYGTATRSFLGMDLGDGILRHPIALYELVFLTLLFLYLKQLQKRNSLPSGHIFKYFMIAYFTFRFFIEFIKPNEFLILGLSSIQYLSMVCLFYYRKTILSFKNHTSHAG